MKQNKLIGFALAMIMSFSLWIVPVSAATESDDNAARAANTLYGLGLFRGVGNNPDGSPNFDLDRTPTREEAITMLVRLFGHDKDAHAGPWRTPFTDVSDWAKPYVGYAYNNGLTFGTSSTTFGGKQTITPSQYLTFTLRALRYIHDEQFDLDAPWELSDYLGITNGEYSAETINFTRGDVAKISESALFAKMQNGDSLLSSLKKSGALADSKLVVMDIDVITTANNKMSFLFLPHPGSPSTYSKLVVNKVNVNGQSCFITDQKTDKEDLINVTMDHPDFSSSGLEYYNSGALNYSTVSFNEDQAKESSTNGLYLNGNLFAVLTFSFECTATLKDGSTVTKTYLLSHFSMQSYAEN